jgi:hypothetical protein
VLVGRSDAAAPGADLGQPLGFGTRLRGLLACVAGAHSDYRGVL